MAGRPSTLPLRRILGAAAIALLVGLAFVSMVTGYSDSWMMGALQRLSVFAAGAVIIGGGVIWVALRLADWRQPASEAEFEAIVQRSEELARADDSDDDEDAYAWEGLDPYDEEDFDELVRLALDDLPLDFQRVLETVPVVVSDKGRRRRAYGLYEGDTVARDNYPDRIIIFRDTLLNDFGHDAEMLREQVTRTVRHEVAHHLGWDEGGVRDLGL